MNEKINQYLSGLQKPSIEWLLKIEEEANRDKVPIMERSGIDFLKQILRIQQPKHILEIGTAIGYSALQMIDAVPNTTVVTVERDHDRIQRAKFHFEQYDRLKKIELIAGDALECVEEISEKGPYDAIFIDAAKGQYKRFFDCFSPLLTDHGIVITDNILFHGSVVDSSQVPKRLQKLAGKINQYNHWLSNHSDFQTIFVPIGDGIAISTKVKEGSINE
ncbi:O-methyltransferase [Amphibacillus sp. MSJ-3]|uniref:O-methyltransferase n=1 Tax=Amphibacillus sp. MSJ-3 TaxID=2841505 RepID=UPI001C0EBBFA|nr:O-methyltransferase [Amphibacillus sp. MSJ-3]MBU5595307.1 O-methyltransferase [Amphibacillus sp. MSJ-3]